MADSRLHDQPDPAPDAPQQMVYRRAPKITPFLVTGGFVGVVVAFIWVAIQGPTAEYSQSQTLGFFAAMFAIVGITLAALWWLLVDRRSKRNMETVYARRTEDPTAADVALTEDDYREWSNIQQKQRADAAHRQRLVDAKAAAKTKKRSARK